MEKHPDFNSDIEKAFKETFLKVDASLKDESLIEPFYAGTTACVALLRNKKLVLSNAGDSRAVLARKNVDGGLKDKLTWKVIDLTEDQNPDLPAEQERIEKMGGYVSPPPEPGKKEHTEKCILYDFVLIVINRSFSQSIIMLSFSKFLFLWFRFI